MDRIEIINFTTVDADEALLKIGVSEVNESKYVRRLLTFSSTIDIDEIETRASLLTELAVEYKEHGVTTVLLNGPGFILPTLVRRIKSKGMSVVFEHRYLDNNLQLITI